MEDQISKGIGIKTNRDKQKHFVEDNEELENFRKIIFEEF
jgi:hypothetical protein